MGHKRQKIPTVHNTKISRAKEGIDSKDLKDYFKVLFHTTVEIVVIVSTSCKVAWFSLFYYNRCLKSRNLAWGRVNNNIFYCAYANGQNLFFYVVVLHNRQRIREASRSAAASTASNDLRRGQLRHFLQCQWSSTTTRWRFSTPSFSKPVQKWFHPNEWWPRDYRIRGSGDLSWPEREGESGFSPDFTGGDTPDVFGPVDEVAMARHSRGHDILYWSARCGWRAESSEDLWDSSGTRKWPRFDGNFRFLFLSIKPLSVTDNSFDLWTAAASHVGHNNSAHVARNGHLRTDAGVCNWKGLYWRDKMISDISQLKILTGIWLV